MGNMRVDVTNIVSVGLIAFLSIWLINRGLKYAGLGQYAA